MDRVIARLARQASDDLGALVASGGHGDPLGCLYGLEGWRTPVSGVHLGKAPGACAQEVECLCAVHVRPCGTIDVIDHADRVLVRAAAERLRDLEDEMAEWLFARWNREGDELVLPPARVRRAQGLVHDPALRTAVEMRLVAVEADAVSFRVRLSAGARFAFALGLADEPRARMRARMEAADRDFSFEG